MSNLKITKENLPQALKKANQLRERIAFELTIVEQAINNTKLSGVLNATYASHTANAIVSDVIKCIILGMRGVVEFFRLMREYINDSKNVKELIKIHKQPSNVDEIICVINGKAITKPLKECPDTIKEKYFQIQRQEIEENVQKLESMLNDTIKKWSTLDTNEKELTNDFSKEHKICIKLWNSRNQIAHFNIEKEEILHIEELRDYFNELTNCAELINLIVNRASYDLEDEHEQDKRSANDFWNLLTK